MDFFSIYFRFLQEGGQAGNLCPRGLLFNKLLKFFCVPDIFSSVSTEDLFPQD